MIIKTLDKYDLQKEFSSYDRDYYSLEGYEAMINLFEETDTNFELDVIALCGDFNEEDEETIRNNYSINEDEEVIEYLNNNTYAIELDNGSIFYQVF